MRNYSPEARSDLLTRLLGPNVLDKSCRQRAVNKNVPLISENEAPGGRPPNYERPRPGVYPDWPVRRLHASPGLRWPSGAAAALLIFKGRFQPFVASALNKNVFRD